ncbi:MAG: BtrH N-terminal domain-containing protein [Specibacter sp.]
MPAAYDPATPISHWDSGLWSRVLAASGTLNPFTGAPFTEAMLAGLGGGIGFMIFTFDYKDLTTASIVTRFHPGPYVDNLLRRSGAAVNVQQTGSAQLAQARLDAALDTGVPVVVRVVRGKLPWAAEDPLADMESMDVAVVARDAEGYLVDDGGGRLGRARAGAQAKARGSRKSDKHWQAHVTAGTGTALTVEVVREAVGETVEALLAETAPPGIPQGYAKNFGLAGMTSWAQRLSDTSTKRGWPRIFADPVRAAQGLGMLHGLLVGNRYSGPGALRPLYAQFLREVAAGGGAGVEPSTQVLADAAEQYEQLGAHWDRLATLVGAVREPDFAAMAGAVEAIAALEAEAARSLRSW